MAIGSGPVDRSPGDSNLIRDPPAIRGLSRNHPVQGPKIPVEAFDLADVARLGVGGQVANGHVFRYALACGLAACLGAHIL